MKDIDKGIKKLNELIELTEDVSSNLNSLKNRQINILIASFITISITLVTIIVSLKFDLFTIEVKDLSNSTFIISSLLFVIALFATMYLYITFLKGNKKIKSERIVLSKLYNMTTEYKRSVVDDLDIVEIAIIDMRLSRLFSTSLNIYEDRNIASTIENDFIVDNKLLKNEYVQHLIENHGLTLKSIKNSFITSTSLEEIRLQLIDKIPESYRHDSSLMCLHDSENKMEIREVRRVLGTRIFNL